MNSWRWEWTRYRIACQTSYYRGTLIQSSSTRRELVHRRQCYGFRKLWVRISRIFARPSAPSLLNTLMVNSVRFTNFSTTFARNQHLRSVNFVIWWAIESSKWMLSVQKLRMTSSERSGLMAAAFSNAFRGRLNSQDFIRDGRSNAQQNLFKFETFKGYSGTRWSLLPSRVKLGHELASRKMSIGKTAESINVFRLGDLSIKSQAASREIGSRRSNPKSLRSRWVVELRIRTFQSERTRSSRRRSLMSKYLKMASLH